MAPGPVHTPVGLHATCLGAKPPPSPLQFSLSPSPKGAQYPCVVARRPYTGFLRERLCTGWGRLTHLAPLFVLLLA